MSDLRVTKPLSGYMQQEFEPIWGDVLPMRSAHEMQAIEFLWYLCQSVNEELPNGHLLKQRLEFIGELEHMRQIRGEMVQVIRKLLGSLDQKRYDQLGRATHMQSLQMVPKSISGMTNEQRDSVIVQRETVCRMGRAFRQNVCNMCDDTPQARAHCEWKKAVQEVTWNDQPMPGGTCIGKIIEWGEFDL